MKHTNEILSILEAEFIRLIEFYNLYSNYEVYWTGYYYKIIELVQLCEKMEIPFDWEWCTKDDNSEIISSITISGKRIEFKE